jgi:uncharacterized protein (TIGR02145 family)
MLIAGKSNVLSPHLKEKVSIMKKSLNLLMLCCTIFIIPVLCQAADCPNCSTNDVTIRDYDYSSDSDCNCTAQTITFGPNVTVPSGAKVMLIAPKVDFKENVTIANGANFKASHCGAYIAPGVWKEFDCYNLAAIGKTTDDDPFTPSWRLIGGYWQWGRKGPDASQWHDTNTANFAHGPTGPDSGEANSATISDWDQTYASDGSWSDTQKTVNDPCPAGFRVPTYPQWRGVMDNNTQRPEGSWTDSFTNYSSARFFGDHLMLPSVGRRSPSNGSLIGRGIYGGYWSSSEPASAGYAWYLRVVESGAFLDFYYRRYGFSVRCIAE